MGEVKGGRYMQPRMFVITVVGVLVAAAAIGGTIAALSARDEDAEPVVAALPTVVEAPPEIAILAPGEAPVAFQGWVASLTSAQKENLKAAVKAKGVDAGDPVGIIVGEDGSFAAFDPKEGPSPPAEGADVGNVEVYMFGDGLPPELR